MIRVGYTYLRTKFMVMVPAHDHDGAYHDCDRALMVVIPTELSHVTLAKTRLVATLVYLQQLLSTKK